MKYVHYTFILSVYTCVLVCYAALPVNIFQSYEEPEVMTEDTSDSSSDEG